MKVGFALQGVPLAEAGTMARRIEQAGYDAVVTQENANEPFLPLAIAATTTERVQLATGVAIAFPRSPMVVAEASWDLQAASGGRFVLGLGSQVKGHNERRFSVPWSAPAPRLKEYVQSLRAIWACWARGGTDLAFIGKHYSFTLMTPNFSPKPMGHVGAPVTIAAVGPAMMRVAGEVCDGVRLHGFCTRKYVENVIMSELQTGFDRGNRTRERFEITGGGFIATGPDEAAAAEMFEWVRYRVAFYGSTRTYWPVFEQHDLLDLGEKLHRMSVAQRWGEMAKEVPDDVVHLFCAYGAWDSIAKRIEERFGGITDGISFQTATDAPPALLDPGLLQDIQRIPTRFESFDLERNAA